MGRAGLRKPTAGDSSQDLWQCLALRKDTERTPGRAFPYLRRKQIPILTVTNPHGSIVIGHSNEIINIRPC